MAKTETIRVAVGGPNGVLSTIWSVVVGTDSSVYIFARPLGGAFKASLHASRRCQEAFTDEFFEDRPEWLEAPHRFVQRWIRAETPNPGSVHVYRIFIPGWDLNPRPQAAPPRKVRWIRPPGQQEFVSVDLWYTRGVGNDWTPGLGAEILAAADLPTGERLWITHVTLSDPSGLAWLRAQQSALAELMRSQIAGIPESRERWSEHVRAIPSGKAPDGARLVVDLGDPLRRSDRDVPSVGSLEHANELIQLGHVRLADYVLACSAVANRQDWRILSNWAVTLTVRGEFAQALDLAEEAIALEPNALPARITRSGLLFKLGSLDEAINEADAALRIDKNCLPAMHNRAAALHGLRRHKEALSVWNRVRRLRPLDAGAWRNVGNILSSLGRHAHARNAYANALRLNPDDHQSIIGLALALTYLGDGESALPLLNHAAWMNPTDPKVLLARAKALARMALKEEALDYTNRFLKASEEIDESHLHDARKLRVFLLMTLGRYREAIFAAAMALYDRPKDADLFSWLAISYQALGDCEEALCAADVAIALDGRSWPALYGRINALLGAGRIDEAILAAETLVNREPGNVAVLELCAKVHSASSNENQAVATLLRAIELGWDAFEEMEQDDHLRRIAGSADIVSRKPVASVVP